MDTRITEWFPLWCLQQINTPTRLHPAGHTTPEWFIRYFHIFYIGKDQVGLQLPLAVFSEDKVTQNSGCYYQDKGDVRQTYSESPARESARE